MLKIIKNVEVYTPEYLGVKDVLVVDGKIGKINENIEITGVEVEVIDGKGKKLVPGFIDSHIHITGGGGEGGFSTRTPEITLSDIIQGGITTIVGTLGTDGITRSPENLYAKAKALEEEGISTYIYTGNYRIPPVTFTGSIMKDLILIDKVIGVGEIAISDHRSSQPTIEELKRIVADARVGGLLSGKTGVVNFHVGNGEDGIEPLFEIVQNTEIPINHLYPTHMNRNKALLEQGLEFAKLGGFVDFTTSSTTTDPDELKAYNALIRYYEAGLIDKVTFTSDGQGSLPIFDEKGNFVKLGIGKVTTLYHEVKHAVLKGLPLEGALKPVTVNPAKVLGLKNKGKIKECADADLVILDESLEIDTVISKGKILMRDKIIVTKGTFEN